MTGLLVSPVFLERCGAELEALERRFGASLERIHPPLGAPLDPALAARIELGFLSLDLYREGWPEYLAAALAARRLRWLQLPTAGTESPRFDPLFERGVIVTSAAGATALPIAHSAIGALLMLARGFLHWGAAQRERAWRPLPSDATPEDLGGQRLTVYGLGHIGAEIARLARALGMHVTGVRRSAPPADAPIDAWLPSSRLHEALPRTQWLALCAPLTPETRGAIGAAELALLPRGARLLNVARGALAVESALVDALRSGQLGGAYLDVFEREPLPADSPLWELPNVILSPHNSPNSRGNGARVAQIFLRNLERWLRKEPLENLVDPAAR